MSTKKSTPSLEAILATAEKLVSRSSTCIVSTLDAEGYPAMRALLAPRFRKGLIHMEFTTNTSSRHAVEAVADSRAGVYFYDPKLFQGLLLKGTLTVSTDQIDRDRIWQDGDEMYYGGGRTDPDYAVLLFTASRGRWYENFMKTDFYLQECEE